jgi:hypothetical protein
MRGYGSSRGGSLDGTTPGRACTSDSANEGMRMTRMKNGIEKRNVAGRYGIAVLLFGTSLLMAACEDEGNPGDDNLLTGGSLVVLVIIVVVVFLVMRRRKS